MDTGTAADTPTTSNSEISASPATSAHDAHDLSVVVLTTGPLEMNCLVVHNGAQATVIDPGMGAAEKIRELVAAKNLTVEQVLLTHGHIDHIRDLPEVQQEYGVPAYMHPADQPWLERSALDALGSLGDLHATSDMDTPVPPTPLADGDTVTIAGATFTAHLMPGHSPGSLMYRGPLNSALGSTTVKTVIFGGDVLFRGGVGRTDLPLADPESMMKSLRRIPEIFADADVLYPGHGETTTIGQEREHNGFLRGVI